MEEKEVKFSWGSYFKPTPKLFRKLGDTLLVVSTFVTTYGVVEGYVWLSISALGIGVLGKFLSNFFTDV